MFAKTLSRLVFLLFLLPVPLLALDGGVHLQLTAPEKALVTGSEGQLLVTLVDADGQPTKATEDLEIDLTTGPDLLSAETVVLTAGEREVAVSLRPGRPGTWLVEASAVGVFPGAVHVTCVEGKDLWQIQPPSVSTSQTTAISPQEIDSPGVEMQVRSLDLGRTIHNKTLLDRVLIKRPDLTLPEEGVRGGEQGRVVLKPELANVRRGADGLYRFKLRALWFQGDKPHLRETPLEMELLFEPETTDRRASQDQLVLQTGQVSVDAEIESNSPGEVEVVALYDRFVSQPITLRFLPSQPSQLAFPRETYELRSLATAELDVLIQFLDKAGRSTVTETAQEVSLSWEGKGGVETAILEVPAGSFQATHKIRLSRFGSHTLRAIGAGFAPVTAEVRLRLDYLLLFVALFGGMVGSVTRLVFTRGAEGWKKGLLRAVVLGLVAAILALLLALFQVLTALEEALPAGLATGISGLPFQNPLAVFLIGLIAGLGLETLFAIFVGRKAQTAAEDSERDPDSEGGSDPERDPDSDPEPGSDSEPGPDSEADPS